MDVYFVGDGFNIFFFASILSQLSRRFIDDAMKPECFRHLAPISVLQYLSQTLLGGGFFWRRGPTQLERAQSDRNPDILRRVLVVLGSEQRHGQELE